MQGNTYSRSSDTASQNMNDDGQLSLSEFKELCAYLEEPSATADRAELDEAGHRVDELVERAHVAEKRTFEQLQIPMYLYYQP